VSSDAHDQPVTTSASQSTLVRHSHDPHDQPATTSASQSTLVRHSGRTPGGTAPSCRFVVRTGTDTSLSLGNATNVTGLDTSLGSTSVIGLDATGHIDCLLQPNGKGLTAVRWNTSNQ
jgi:hypothetical protein